MKKLEESVLNDLRVYLSSNKDLLFTKYRFCSKYVLMILKMIFVIGMHKNFKEFVKVILKFNAFNLLHVNEDFDFNC